MSEKVMKTLLVISTAPSTVALVVMAKTVYEYKEMNKQQILVNSVMKGKIDLTDKRLDQRDGKKTEESYDCYYSISTCSNAKQSLQYSLNCE